MAAIYRDLPMVAATKRLDVVSVIGAGLRRLRRLFFRRGGLVCKVQLKQSCDPKDYC